MLGIPQNTYYEKIYGKIQRAGLQGWGNSLVDLQVERYVSRKLGDRILEIGASSGEHLQFVSEEPLWAEYVCLDLEPGISNPILFNEIKEKKESLRAGGVKFVKADAENIPYPDNTFDLALSTCVLAHVNNPEKVLMELRRVVKSRGMIVLGMPCDPGILNRLIKRLVTFPKMRQLGVANPELIYSREHKNSIHALKTFISACFAEDDLRFSWFPFQIPFWNLELILTSQITIIKPS